MAIGQKFETILERLLSAAIRGSSVGIAPQQIKNPNKNTGNILSRPIL
jgi:hypothetical protein